MIGPAQDVLKELKARVFGTESGAVLFTWDSAHGRRVARIEETDESTSGEAVVTGNEPVDYVQVGGILPAPKNADESTDAPAGHPIARYVAKSFAEAWRTVWQPKEPK